MTGKESSELPAWLAHYRGMRLGESMAPASADGWILQPLQYAIELVEEAKLTDPWFATLQCMEEIYSGAILVYALRKADLDTFAATALVWRMETSPRDDYSPWIEVIGVDGKILTDELFDTAVALFDVSCEETPPRRLRDRQIVSRQSSEPVAPEPPWHALLQSLSDSGAALVTQGRRPVRTPIARQEVSPPTLFAHFQLWQTMVQLKEALEAGNGPLIDCYVSALASRAQALAPSTAKAINRLAEVLDHLDLPDIFPATVAAIALRYLDQVEAELESSLQARDRLLHPPYMAPPFDEATRKTLRGLMLSLWGQCTTEIVDYDKKSWQSVCQQLNQIRAMDR